VRALILTAIFLLAQAVDAQQKKVLDVENTLRYTWAANAVQDIAQTADFSANGHKELNPLVKRWVDSKRLFPFVVATAAGCYLFDRAVQSIKNPTLRIIAYGLAAGIEIYAVAHNKKLFRQGFPVIYLKFKVK
jgi:hypothetical protein